MGTVHGLPVRPRLDAPCPAWCAGHIAGALPVNGREFPYVVHRGAAPFSVPGMTAWLEHDISTEDDGQPFSDGPALWLDDGDGKVQIPVELLEQVAAALVDAAAVLRQ